MCLTQVPSQYADDEETRCAVRYATLKDAAGNCSLHNWCSGVVHDGGLPCSGLQGVPRRAAASTVEAPHGVPRRGEASRAKTMPQVEDSGPAALRAENAALRSQIAQALQAENAVLRSQIAEL